MRPCPPTRAGAGEDVELNGWVVVLSDEVEFFRGQNALLARASTHLQLEEEFDPVDTLTRAAHLAITRALSSTPVVTKASDMKTLVDAAANALTMAEKIGVNEMHPTLPRHFPLGHCGLLLASADAIAYLSTARGCDANRILA
jgi:hypothetical protein